MSTDLAGVAAAVKRALSAFGLPLDSAVAPLGRGLINVTFRVDAASGSFVLQKLNPLFDPAIHENIRAVTERLAAVGLPTPRLRPTPDGRLFADLGPDGVWRVFTRVEGVTFDTVQNLAQARAAGELVGKFHSAIEGMSHRFVGLRLGVHDTPRHLATLREALATYRDHRLFGAVAPLAAEILAAAEDLPPLPDSPLRPGHGDLKFNNVLFAGVEPPGRDQALCLVDLDTLGPVHLGHEIGDAWRSWCNPCGEDRVDARFDLEIYAASLEGYRRGLGRLLRDDELGALLGGVEWVSLELAARFAADALRESYFGWDRLRFAGAGEHNLVRARSQWALHRAVVDVREPRARLLGL